MTGGRETMVRASRAPESSKSIPCERMVLAGPCKVRPRFAHNILSWNLVPGPCFLAKSINISTAGRHSLIHYFLGSKLEDHCMKKIL